MRRIAAAFILWLWFCALPFGAAPVTLILRQPIGMPPYYLVFTVQVEPHALNRELCVAWGNVGWEKNLWNRSCRQLEGLTSQRTYYYPVSPARIIREPGVFVVEARVIRADTKTFQAQTRVFVGGIPDDIGGP